MYVSLNQVPKSGLRSLKNEMHRQITATIPANGRLNRENYGTKREVRVYSESSNSILSLARVVRVICACGATVYSRHANKRRQDA